MSAACPQRLGQVEVRLDIVRLQADGCAEFSQGLVDLALLRRTLARL